MWTSSWAINGFLACGLTSLWPVHAMEHQLSAVYDVTHGHGLAVLTPVWMRYILNDDNVDRFVNYGVNVFGISPDKKPYEIAELAIQKTEEVFEKMAQDGLDQFTFELIEQCEKTQLNAREKFYIDFYGSKILLNEKAGG